MFPQASRGPGDEDACGTTRRHDDTTTRLFMTLGPEDARVAGGQAAGMRGRGDLERREGVSRKIGPEASRSAEAPIRHWLPIHLRTEVILDRLSDHPSRGRIVRPRAGGSIFHASEAGAAALHPCRPALHTRTQYPPTKYVCSWNLGVGSCAAQRRGAYQITRTTPDDRISPSREISGSSRSRAAAQTSASKGSRLTRISSPISTCSAVRSYG